MSNKPRTHHFVPQFWIKRFIAKDGKLWAYDRNDDRTRVRSSKALMQIFNLYTVEPNGLDDTTLETVDLGNVDRKGNAAFDRLLNGDHSEAAKAELSNFLSAQIMRDPDTIVSYNPKAQELTLSLLEIFDAPDYPTFARKWGQCFPGAEIKETEYNYIQSQGLKNTEASLDQIITALEPLGGLPALPFTDVVRNPSARAVLRDELLKLNWSLKTDVNAGFVLGDTGLVYERGALRDGLRAPLSSSVALCLEANANPSPGIVSTVATQPEVDALNLEAAARARRWMVGEPLVLDKLKSQVGGKGLPRT